MKPADVSYLYPEDAVPWSPHGLYLKERPSFTLDPLFHAGCYYVQDASAMFVGWMFRQVLSRFRGRKVLDLCAAPGGKTTDLASSMRETFGTEGFLLVANEVIRQRSLILLDNVARWGDPDVVVTGSDAREFSSMERFFDIIVADVPCSGEGMFRKSENARNMWSEDNVALCASRQRRIIADVWNSLDDGGVLVYSTCTLNDEENDNNIQWIIDELGATPLVFESPFDGPRKTRFGFLLEPGIVQGEGQYCAALVKGGTLKISAESSSAVEAATGDMQLRFFNRDDGIYCLTPYVSEQMQLIGRRLNVLGAGTHSFNVKGKDRIPCADLALSCVLNPDDFPSVELTREDALHFLHKDALVLKDAPVGFLVVRYRNHPLGFVKNLGNRANNLHPAGRRILMDIDKI